MTEEQELLKDFVAWCKRRKVALGSELGILKERAEKLLPPERVKIEYKDVLSRYRFVDERHP